MGLLDALFQNDSGGGLLGGLPQSWQWQNPDYTTNKDDFLKSLRANAENSGGLPQSAPPSPFGAVPQFAQPQPPSVFGVLPQGGQASMGPIGAMPGAPGPMAGTFMPPQAQPQMQPQQPQAAPQAAPAPAPQPQDSPINNMNIGGYQMPQMGSPADYTPQTAQAPSTDISAQSRVAPQQPQDLPPALGGQPSSAGIGDRLGAGFNSFIGNAHTGPVGALLGGLSGLVTGQRNDAVGVQQQNLAAQYQAVRQTLIQSGSSPQEANSKAMLAVMNPEAGKTILSEALTNREKYQKTGTDAFGGEQYGFVNERDQTINGKALGQGETQSSGGFLAPGVKSIDSTLKGNDYLTQFSPEVQAAVTNYIDGKSMPTGNPRKGFTQTVKMIAQKVGADTGQSVDDTTYAARRTMRNQLSSSAPSSLGGQINIGNTAAGHLADLTQKAIELGNVDTGIAPLTSAVNSVRGLGTEQAAKMEALKGAAQHYGQEITKFYAGSPGGTAERDRFIESVNGARSPKELAAILSTEGELMRSRLDALGGQIKGVLGEEGAKQYPVLRADGEAALAKVEQNVSRLKGGQAAPASGGIPSGWSVKVH